MPPAILCRLVLLTIAALSLTACSSSEDTDPVGPAPVPTPLAITDLNVVGGTAASITLAWTSPQYVDKATIRYDLRYIPFGSESMDWDSWTVAAAPQSDSASGQDHRHVVTSLPTGATYSFGLKASTDGAQWTEISNITVATVSLIYDTTPPAPITGLFMYQGASTSVTMGWPIAGDDGIYGQAESYQARYSTLPITPADWDAATPVPGDITASSIPGMMETVITGLTTGQEYYVAVKATDDRGLTSDLSNVAAAMPVDMTTLYVNVEGTGDYATIEEAVMAATIGDVILVGPGRYTWTNQAAVDSLHPMITVPRWFPEDDFYDFEIRSLAGPEATILDAERKGNCMAVTGGVVGSGDDREYAGITIDGFTFTNGKATGLEPSDDEGWSGAGLNLHLTDTVVRNCIFTGNQATYGAGLWCGGQGDALIENCLFEDNLGKFGGAICLMNSEPRITMRDCVIRNNHATFRGGGMWAYNVLATLENLLIVGNTSSDEGGGVFFSYMNEGSQFIHSTVADNHVNGGAAIVLEGTGTEQEEILLIESVVVAYNSGSGPFRNVVNSWLYIGCSLVYGNDVTNAFPYNHTDLGGNLVADPLFCDRVGYLLQGDSPCLLGNHPDGNDCGTMGARGIGCDF